MKIFEPHIHMHARTTDDYESLALAGVRAIVEPSFWLGQPRTQVGAFIDYWSSIADYEWKRAYSSRSLQSPNGSAPATRSRAWSTAASRSAGGSDRGGDGLKSVRAESS